MQFIKNTAKSYLFFIIILPLAVLIYTFIIYFFFQNITKNALNISTFLLLLFVFFLYGIINGIINKKKGLISATSASLILYIFIILINIIVKSFDTSLLIKAICCSLLAGVGGLIGVNLKKK